MLASGLARPRLAVVGHGMAAVRLCEELDARAPNRFAVTVHGEEARPGYNRVLLSSWLAGESTDEDVALRGTRWYAERGIALETGRAVASLEGLDADAIVLATGSEAVRLRLPGAELEGVMTFRHAGDVEALRRRARAGAQAVVIGGGLLGLEAAWGLVRAGIAVTVVHAVDRLMERQLDARGAAFLKAALERRGLRFRLSATTLAILGREAAEGVALASGEVLPASLVVMAVGVRPRVELAREAGLCVNRGVIVDDGLACARADGRPLAAPIYAIGECAEHRGVAHGLVEPAHEQAAVLARRLAGEDAAYAGTVPSTNLKVSGVGVFSAGAHGDDAEAEFVTYEGRGRQGPEYRKLALREDRLVGAVLVGEAGDARFYRDLIRSGEALGARRDDLIFGRAAFAGLNRAA